MSFGGHRLPKEQAFLDKLLPALGEKGVVITWNGTEHTHGEFMGELRQSQHPTALALRFQPDIIAYLKTTPTKPFYIEAKSGETIERNAYEQYKRVADLGHIVTVVFEALDWRWNFVGRIALRSGETTVNRFCPESRFAVRDDWVCPRESPQ